MRIAIDARRILDFGIGTYLRNLLEGFNRIPNPHEFLLIAHPEDAKCFEHLPPSRFIVVPHQLRDTDRRDHIVLSRLVRNLDVDLTHVPINRVPIFLPKPYVVTIHDLSALLFDESPDWLHQLRRFRFMRSARCATRIISVSAATSKDLIDNTGVDPQRVRVIHNAPEPGVFAAPAPEFRTRILERYQINYPFILYVGHIRKQKNIPRLVEAFAVLRQEIHERGELEQLRLIIIGDEIYRHPEVRRAVRQTRVEQRVRFLGFVPADALRVFYESASAFVFPSLYEGFGLPPLEAMACGSPVVASNIGALQEVAGDAALLVNPENVFEIARGIGDVLLDGDLRRQLIERGRRRVHEFSWTKAAQQTLEIYAEAGM